MSNRIFNFSAGPAVLPEPVLKEARENVMSLGQLGMGIMEISHRSKPFEDILAQAVADFRELLGVSQDYEILLLQGGATLQFSMVPMNLLPAGQTADYVVTGVWSEKALKEAQRVGEVHVAADTKPSNHDHIPAASEIRLSAAPAYVHFTSNNTIFGTQWAREPGGADGKLVADASSDILSRPLEVRKYLLIYAGAQKNLGPSGLTVVIVRRDVLQRCPAQLPVYLNYRTHAENESMYNTPNTWAVYILQLVLQWMKHQGGLAAIEKANRRKADIIYQAIDSTGFYRGHARRDSRSLMNITFRLPTEDLEKRFASEAEAAGLSGLKGHRSVGGLRASVYNACPFAAAEALVQFMKDFEARNG